MNEYQQQQRIDRSAFFVVVKCQKRLKIKNGFFLNCRRLEDTTQTHIKEWHHLGGVEISRFVDIKEN